MQIAKCRSVDGPPLLLDYHVSFIGQDLCILLIHQSQQNEAGIRQLVEHALADAMKVSIEEGLERSTSAHPAAASASAAMDIHERPGEQFLVVTAYGTSPGLFNFPLYRAMSHLKKPADLQFRILDFRHPATERVIDLSSPNTKHDIAAFTREPSRYVVQSISRVSGEAVAAIGICQDNGPILLVRIGAGLPSSSEILTPFAFHDEQKPFDGWLQYPLMPVALDTPAATFNGLGLVTCAAFSMHAGRLSDPVDCFAHPFWQIVREHASRDAIELQRHVYGDTSCQVKTGTRTNWPRRKTG
jgi:fructose 1,6-bisphosphate aldolase/phosphatase